MLTQTANSAFENNILPQQIRHLREYREMILFTYTGYERLNQQLIHLGLIDQFICNLENVIDLRSQGIQSYFKENTQELKEVLAQIEEGWPVRSKFGNKNGCLASDSAWFITQHSDFDIEFQKSVLHTLERLKCRDNKSPEYAPDNLAYLHDRIQANCGQPQRYGTQGTKEDGIWFPRACETDDIEKINEHRKSLRVCGGMSLQEYYAHMNGDISDLPPIKFVTSIMADNIATPNLQPK